MIGVLNHLQMSFKIKCNDGAGRESLARELEIKRANGVVYTPSNLANFVADKVIESYAKSFARLEGAAASRIKILDPACGNGELLAAVWNSFKHTFSQAKNELPNPSELLCGIDIDDSAVQQTKTRIIALSPNCSEFGEYNLLTSNALFPFNKSRKAGWEIVKSRFKATTGFDIVIANPPWGADTQAYANLLSNGDYSFCIGQYDTSDLFVELALSIVKDGGYIAFIVPDSLFNGGRTLLRKKLAKETEIVYLGRLGEKIFGNTNRACAVLICRKFKPNPATKVECMRLTPELRNAILGGTATFKQAEHSVTHKVHQSRFASNNDYLFDIDLKEIEESTLIKLKDQPNTFQDYLMNFRGIELSKKGDVCRCRQCNRWLAYPRVKYPSCPHCNSPLDSFTNKTKIISHLQTSGYSPIFVGESVKRYFLTAPYWIATDKAGINYKDLSIYSDPKILVRKTGVGLSASIDYSGCLTNQVVYIFKLQPMNVGLFPIEMFLAILNSRAMYYYLAKKHGETEWRSHPYLTQRQIMNLPLPELNGTQARHRIIDEITESLKPFLVKRETLPTTIDAKIEYLVAKLFGLSEEDYARIYSTLNNVQDLIPIRPLKAVSIKEIFANRD